MSAKEPVIVGVGDNMSSVTGAEGQSSMKEPDW